jgi:hypothetical protein
MDSFREPDFSSPKPIIISLARQPSGNYQFSSQSADGASVFYSGISAARTREMVPDYILPLLGDLLPPAEDGAE